MKLAADVRLKILVVDDDMDLGQVIESDLVKNGFEVVCVSRGVEAHSLLQKEKFDLVLCDWRLPDLGGLDLLGFVQQQLGIPFVLMTGFSDFIDKQAANCSGATAFLSKPFNSSALHAAIAQALGGNGTASPRNS
jgi:DNA-binding response OmpR family regulator